MEGLFCAEVLAHMILLRAAVFPCIPARDTIYCQPLSCLEVKVSMVVRRCLPRASRLFWFVLCLHYLLLLDRTKLKHNCLLIIMF